MDITLDSIRDIRLFQSKTGYRYSVDSLLLYDFIRLKTARRIADLGAGSGIVGILLAKKYPAARVSLLELQKGLYALAKRNIVLNGLEHRAAAVWCDLSNLHTAHCSPSTFDLVVSNPPFRKHMSGRINVEEERAIARHEIKMKLCDVVRAASSLLRARGRFCLVYHPNRLAELGDSLKSERLEPKRIRFVHSDDSTEAKMVLVEAVKDGRAGLKVESPFFIYTRQRGYTDEMQRIYTIEKDFFQGENG
jgi:tRNA1Val (adenine37-N6)-methyltransferase